MLLGRPVKWIEDRVENLTAGGHARSEQVEVAAAVDDSGRILALEVEMTLDQGSYPALPVPTPLFVNTAKVLSVGPYRIDALRWRGRVVATNKSSYAAYRGPWAMESLLREGIIDRIAIELGRDPVEIRRRNLYGSEDEDPRTITGASLAGVTARQTLDMAVGLIGYDEFRCKQREARAHGRLPGIGIATFIEPAPGPPEWGALIGSPRIPEAAFAKLELGGLLTVFTAQVPHGQSHATTIGQVAADTLGVPLEHVRVVHGDTSFAPFSLIGTGGSRAATMASGAAIDAVRKLKEKILRLVALDLDVAPDDLSIVEGWVRPQNGASSGIPLSEIARRAHLAMPEGEEAGLRTAGSFTEPEGGWAQATHCATVEIDPGTGHVEITRYVVVHDCGDLINPAVVEGQIRGGIAQGIGQALLEQAAYGEDGTFRAATFLDYLVPTTTDVPRIEIAHLESAVQSEVNYRGVGEGGAIVSVPTIVNAVQDALAEFGTHVNALPITPLRIIEAIARK
jgi:carbon-monoxide dehydrogenase large subunit